MMIREPFRDAERRYNEQLIARARRQMNMELRHDGGDWQQVDEPERVIKRLVDLGMIGLAGEAMRGGRPGAPPEIDVLERIIGSNNLTTSDFLFRGAQVARTVARVVIRNSSKQVLGFGTGFLVSPRLIMTNNHVLSDPFSASNSLLQFDYFERHDGTINQAVEHELRPSAFFATDRRLDFTVAAVEETNASGARVGDRGWNPLISDSGKAIVGEAVNLIQHPLGEPQQVALRENRVVDVLPDFLHYESDTERGSSGSGVFNDQWVLAGLHHAGVPKRDEEGRILLRTGEPWDGRDSTAGLIAWVANEGIRISRIVDHLRAREETFSGLQRALLDELLSGEAPPVPDPGPSPDDETILGRKPIVGEDGYVRWTVPMEVAVGLGGGFSPGQPGTRGLPAPDAGRAPRPDDAGVAVDDDALSAALTRLRDAEQRPYLEEDVEVQRVAAYYEDIRQNLSKANRFRKLSELLIETHSTVLSYKAARLEHLYPWIDLREEGLGLASIYSGETSDAEEVIRQEFAMEAMRDEARAEFMRTESALDEEAMETFLADLEAQFPFNCEHVVPQSWFNKKQPMKADLHHLFTCESDCNSFRSNIPYFQFPPAEEVVRLKCGRREDDRFEPAAGKGAVARASLYFLLRYPGQVGNAAGEMTVDRLETLLRWHGDHPMSRWELHRNAEIAKVQGNRNPLIDHPEWAEKIDFELGFSGLS